MTNSGSSYDASNVQPLHASLHVRKRIPMYFDTHQVIHEMIWSVLAEAVDQCAPPGKRYIHISLRENAIIEITHNGKGYPANDYWEGASLLQLILTEAFAAAPGPTPQTSIGEAMSVPHLSTVNPASKKLIATTTHQGYRWQQTYEKGLPVSDVEKVSDIALPDETGTTIWFQPDLSIIEEREVDYWDLLWQFQFLAGFIPDIELTLHDQRTGAEIPEPVHIQPCDQLDAPLIHEPVVLEVAVDNGVTEAIALEIQYHDTRQPCMNAYFNGLPELELRPYLIYLIDDLLKYLNRFMHKYSDAPQNLLTLTDICAGLSLDLYKRGPSSSHHRGSPGAVLQGQIADSMDSLRITNPKAFYQMVQKCLDNRQMRKSE